MFLEPGAKNSNKNRLVAPTGFEPVFGHGHVFASSIRRFLVRWPVGTRRD
jgi:hypothetical protein